MKQLCALLLIFAACRRETPVADNQQPTTSNPPMVTTAQPAQLEPVPITAANMPYVETHPKPLPKVTPKRALGIAAIPAASSRRRAVAASTPIAIPATPMDREGVAFTITSTPIGGRRMNLLLNANANVPPQLWNDAGFLAWIGASGGTFPVRLWREREGLATYVQTIRVPSHGSASGQWPLSADAFRRGDVAIVETTPGIMIVVDENGHVILPMVSNVEPQSSDPTRLLAARRRFVGAQP